MSVILLDSIFVNADKDYYPQILLEECKYAIKNKKHSKYNHWRLRIEWIWWGVWWINNKTILGLIACAIFSYVLLNL